MVSKYSVLHKAFELACKDLDIVNNPNKAPISAIMGYYISKSEKELANKQNDGENPKVESNPRNKFIDENFNKNVSDLKEIGFAIFNELNDNQLNYYRDKYVELVDKVISSYRTVRNTYGDSEGRLSEILCVLKDVQYRLLSCNSGCFSGFITFNSDSINMLESITDS